MIKKYFLIAGSLLFLLACKPSPAQTQTDSDSVFFIPDLNFHNYRLEYLISYQPINIDLFDIALPPDQWQEHLQSHAISLHSTQLSNRSSENIDEYIDNSVTKFEWNLRSGKFHPYCPKGNRLKAVDTIQRENNLGTFLKSTWSYKSPEVQKLNLLITEQVGSTLYIVIYLSMQDQNSEYRRTTLQSLKVSLSG